jgi:hypothetical protein
MEKEDNQRPYNAWFEILNPEKLSTQTKEAYHVNDEKRCVKDEGFWFKD